MALVFDSSFTPQYGKPVELSKGILRLTVNNPSAFTFHGTNSYIIGTDTLAIIDPGPEDEAHYNALITAIAGRPVSHIFVSHTHRDHSPLAQRLKESLGARTVAEGAHRPARPYYAGEVNMLEASADTDFIPDIALADGGTIEGDGWALEGIHTPGHAANHMAFGLKNTGVLFSADHVMAWATSIVAPPDGSMADYMASLDKLIARRDHLLLPGHGGPVKHPLTFLRALKTHRRMRERQVLACLGDGLADVDAIVARIYPELDEKLRLAARLTVESYLEKLREEGRMS